MSISVVAHSVIFFKSTDFNILPAQKNAAKIEVNYLIKRVKQPPEQNGQLGPAKSDSFLKLPSKIVAANRLPPPSFGEAGTPAKIERSDSMVRGRLLQSTDFMKARSGAAISKKITLSSPDANIAKNPAYIGYYQFNRERIKRAAYRQNYAGKEEGEVTVSFVIASDGALKHIRLVEEVSCPSPYLRNIAVESIREAAPFPKFPSELDYPQIPFTLTITFQN
ncbi:MAG: energy transducer TonB [Candidatus Omnitrophota bacterium]|nr:energy transducer TonB [Candidatus Omnitrophota bacterium]